MNAKQQLIENYNKLNNINFILANLAEMEKWEILEYKSVRQSYIDEILRLENHIEINKEYFN